MLWFLTYFEYIMYEFAFSYHRHIFIVIHHETQFTVCICWVISHWFWMSEWWDFVPHHFHWFGSSTYEFTLLDMSLGSHLRHSIMQLLHLVPCIMVLFEPDWSDWYQKILSFLMFYWFQSVVFKYMIWTQTWILP